MQVVKANLWLYPARVKLITTNSYVAQGGKLVMGRGVALQATEMYPGIAYRYGKLIPHLGRYGVMFLADPEYREWPGLFQVKYHFKQPADLELIKYSVECLKKQVLESPVKTVWALNYPGIGWGQRTEEEVLPLISELPDNVVVCKL
jgi:hypothetical protein